MQQGQEDPFELDSNLWLSSGRPGEDRKRQFTYLLDDHETPLLYDLAHNRVSIAFYVKLVKNRISDGTCVRVCVCACMGTCARDQHSDVSRRSDLRQLPCFMSFVHLDYGTRVHGTLADGSLAGVAHLL